MANPEHVEIVLQGAAAIDAWRAKNSNTPLDLSNAELWSAKLPGVDLSGVDLHRAKLFRADLRSAKFRQSALWQASLEEADLSDADLTNSDLRGTNFREAKLDRASLNGAILFHADLFGATMHGTTFLNLQCVGNSFANVDLSEARCLERVLHGGPSSIGMDTLFKSQGKIPAVFLRGCGVPDALITYLPSLIGAMEPMQFQSCFISYSSKDDEFARRLYGRMRDEKLRVWFDQEDMQGGKKVMEQIDRAIQVNDRLLLVLSESSLKSEWVKTEIRKAHHAELRLPKSSETSEVFSRQKLFPIRLVSIDRIRDWSCFDADTGKDLAVELREYHIPDFSNWKDHDAFEAAFADLLRDLRAEA